MRKIFLCLALIFASTMALSAQSAATYRDGLSWDPITLTASWSLTGYDVLMTQTNVTAAQLGSTNGIPVLAGTIGYVRTPSTSINFSSIATMSTPASPYLVWTRAVVFPVGQTNIYVSDWSSAQVNWLVIPAPPTNLRVVYKP
jgi:hypothetical protein